MKSETELFWNWCGVF